jgi:cysteinyl-tRNA synthetase
VAERGGRDPREGVRPYVELLLDLRAAARDTHDFATSDRVRDRLESMGIEVRDAPEGTQWSIRPM